MPDLPHNAPPPSPPPTAGVGNGRQLAIFDLLEHIVNEPPPRLPQGLFSEEFVAFVDSCLKKNPDERADLKSLIVSGPRGGGLRAGGGGGLRRVCGPQGGGRGRTHKDLWAAGPVGLVLI